MPWNTASFTPKSWGSIWPRDAILRISGGSWPAFHSALRISETTAKNTYRSFVTHGLISPKKLLDAGWDFLVYPVMREGGYVRHDGRKSIQVLRDCEMLTTEYGGIPKSVARRGT